MKKISHAIVLVEDIRSSLPRSQFSEADLDEAAQLLLKIKGVITPLILLETGVDSYKVIDGDFEYYAALKAGEIDPLQGETINAYLVEDEADVAIYKKQVEVFRQQSLSKPVIKENTMSEQLHVMIDAIKRLSDQVANMSEQIKTLKTVTSTTIEKPVPETTPIKIASSEEEKTLLEDINTLPIMELNLKLENITGKNVRTNILKARQNPSFKPFTSSNELIKGVKGLGDKSFDAMLDKFNKL
ncbi:hypothetical protein [Candidatus Marithrix sp. Canyon 246]|uniref:hypothetical protein n=1 Tax=Candidatus Marithrix sp. Canyon 246 TaxID=1827136 RepID=UPI000849EDE3|nr:hypothetical protein [Candidatus Marithrix sp. Canyon 246]